MVCNECVLLLHCRKTKSNNDKSQTISIVVYLTCLLVISRALHPCSHLYLASGSPEPRNVYLFQRIIFIFCYGWGNVRKNEGDLGSRCSHSVSQSILFSDPFFPLLSEVHDTSNAWASRTLRRELVASSGCSCLALRFFIHSHLVIILFVLEG